MATDPAGRLDFTRLRRNHGKQRKRVNKVDGSSSCQQETEGDLNELGGGNVRKS